MSGGSGEVRLVEVTLDYLRVRIESPELFGRVWRGFQKFGFLNDFYMTDMFRQEIIYL
jgi:hypothetical protein